MADLSSLINFLKQLDESEEAKTFIVDPAKHDMDMLGKGHPWVNEKYYFVGDNPFLTKMPGLGLLLLLKHIDDTFQQLMNPNGSTPASFITSMKEQGYEIFPVSAIEDTWLLSGIRLKSAVYVL